MKTNETMEINYLGKTLKTDHNLPMTDEHFEKVKADFFAKPSEDLVCKQMKKVSKDGVMHNHITRYFFRDIMAKTVLWHSKWSVEEMFNNKTLIEYFYWKINANRKMFPEEKGDSNNIERAIALGGKGIGTFPSDFPMKTIDAILENYNINNNYYDFSCGWGVRLMSSFKHNVNYFGTDPNYMLTERLEQMTKMWKETVPTVTSNVDIRTQGSEVFVPEWENTMGLAFSSPPYFNLEDYKVGDQSYKEGVSYDQWKENYFIPTLKNIYKYLIPEGLLIINVKDYKNYSLEKDTIEMAEQCGFKQVDIAKLENIKRINCKAKLNDNGENCYIFIKE